MSNQVWKFHNDVDTDQIIASQYLLLPDVEEMKQYTFESLDPDFARKVHEGDLVVAGENFGCGSSREQAPSVLKALGVKAVIAKSYARIFYRNSINIGFPVIVCKELYDHVKNGDTAELDLSAGTVTAGGETFSCTKLPAYMQNILSQGGLIASLNKEPIPSGSAKQDGSEIEHPTDSVRNKHAFTEEPIPSGSAKQDGNEIEHPTDFVRNKHAFTEEEA